METVIPIIHAQAGIHRHPWQPVLGAQRTRLKSAPRMLREHLRQFQNRLEKVENSVSLT